MPTFFHACCRVLRLAGVAKPAILLNVEELLAAGMEEVHIIVQVSAATALCTSRACAAAVQRLQHASLPVVPY